MLKLKRLESSLQYKLDTSPNILQELNEREKPAKH